MKIGVISDTHDRMPPFRRAVALFGRLGVGAVFHAGDYVAPFAARLIAPDTLKTPLYCIYGNNDGDRAALKEVLPGLVDGPLTVTLANRTIVMHHFIDWLKPRDMQGADVILTGHTHEPTTVSRDGHLFVNPGECCGWVADRCTVAIVDLDSLTADVVEVHD